MKKPFCHYWFLIHTTSLLFSHQFGTEIYLSFSLQISMVKRKSKKNLLSLMQDLFKNLSFGTNFNSKNKFVDIFCLLKQILPMQFHKFAWRLYLMRILTEWWTLRVILINESEPFGFENFHFISLPSNLTRKSSCQTGTQNVLMQEVRLILTTFTPHLF